MSEAQDKLTRAASDAAKKVEQSAGNLMNPDEGPAAEKASLTDRAKGAAEQVGKTLSDNYAQAAEKGREYLDKGREAVGQGREAAAEYVQKGKEVAGEYAEKGKQYAQDLGHQASDAIQQRPIPAVLIAAGIGVAVGMLIGHLMSDDD